MVIGMEIRTTSKDGRVIEAKDHTPPLVPPKRLELGKAYELCAELTRQHSKTFYFSTSFLPPEKRRAIRAFYAFCRTTDDIVDAPHGVVIDLNEWRQASRRPLSQQTHPVLQAWADTRDRYQIPQQFVEELIDGCEMDLTINRYETFDQLTRYCYCVASTVGLISSYIIGMQDTDPRAFERAKPQAIDLGIALQLTNILRDIGEDLGRGRIYLPQEDMRRFNYTEHDLRNSVLDSRFKALMRFEMDRADALYDQSLPGLAHLKSDGRLAVGAAAMLYRGILGKIHLHDYNVFQHRAHLTQGEKVQRLPGIFLSVRRLKS